MYKLVRHKLSFQSSWIIIFEFKRKSVNYDIKKVLLITPKETTAVN